MRLLRHLVLFAGLAVCTPASAQLVITQADIQAQLSARVTHATFSGQIDNTVRAGLQALAERSGDNQTWDFTFLSFLPQFQFDMEPVALPVPGATGEAFAPATHAQRYSRLDSSWFALHRLGADAFELVGISGAGRIGGVDTTFGYPYTPPRLVFPLPLTHTSSWMASYALGMPVAVPGMTIEVEEQASVEGWGTLITPHGQAGTLKLRTRYVTTSTIPIPDLPPVTVRDTSYFITFYTRPGFGANLNLGRDGQVSMVTYTTLRTNTSAEAPAEASAFRLDLSGPLPARRGTPLQVHYHLETVVPARVEVYDVRGRRVATLAGGAPGAGQHTVALQTDGLAAGVYFVRLWTTRSSTTQAFVLLE